MLAVGSMLLHATVLNELVGAVTPLSVVTLLFELDPPHAANRLVAIITEVISVLLVCTIEYFLHFLVL
jgi:hypothetical protein